MSQIEQAVAESSMQSKDAERARLAVILTRHAAFALAEGDTLGARLLERLGLAVSASGDDGAPPVCLACCTCDAPRGLYTPGTSVPPCHVCGDALTLSESDL